MRSLQHGADGGGARCQFGAIGIERLAFGIKQAGKIGGAEPAALAQPCHRAAAAVGGGSGGLPTR